MSLITAYKNDAIRVLSQHNPHEAETQDNTIPNYFLNLALKLIPDANRNYLKEIISSL